MDLNTECCICLFNIGYFSMSVSSASISKHSALFNISAYTVSPLCVQYQSSYVNCMLCGMLWVFFVRSLCQAYFSLTIFVV